MCVLHRFYFIRLILATLTLSRCSCFKVTASRQCQPLPAEADAACRLQVVGAHPFQPFHTTQFWSNGGCVQRNALASETTSPLPKPFPSSHQEILTGLNHSNFSMLPPRLKNHFINLMHQFVQPYTRYPHGSRHPILPNISVSLTFASSAQKMWSTMSASEQEDLRNLSTDLCLQQTLLR
jgi:hypothetical protein